MRTTIILPLVHWSRVLGVINLESTSCLEITEVAKDELLLLADAVAILSELRQTNRAQVTGTRAALSDLKAVLSSTKFPRITKPQVFVAFSGRADDEVVGVIQQVLSEFDDVLRIVLWNRIEESGSITLRLIEKSPGRHSVSVISPNLCQAQMGSLKTTLMFSSSPECFIH
jgi:hypothetical protein